MKSTVNFSQFCDSFSETYRNNFTYEGKRALFDYLEEYEESTGEEIELDPIALCCEFTQYDDLAELQANYSNIESMEDLENNTTVIPVLDNYGKKTDSFIIIDY